MNKCDLCSESQFDKLWLIKHYEIIRCVNCGLVFANVTQSDILHAYEQDYYKKFYPDYESDSNIHERNSIAMLRSIEKYFAPGCLIEIGSAFGFFLGIAAKRNWRGTGYEMSGYASAMARDKYHQDVRTTDFLLADIREQVDVVVMFDTIEHLLNPSLYVEKIYKTLKDGGGLIITTGDLSSGFARVFGKKWWMFVPPLHVYYYSRETITRLLERYGFEVLSITADSKYQNLNSIFQYAFGIKKELLPSFPVKVNMGDIMQVIARKRK